MSPEPLTALRSPRRGGRGDIGSGVAEACEQTSSKCSATPHSWRRRAPGWLSPALLGLVLAVALIWGSGALAHGRVTAVQRAHALEATIRCPSCVDVSVADSSAPTAASLRQQILRWVNEGQSDQEIENALVARYGLSILLQPPPSGLTVVVWVVPAVAGAGALGALTVLFWRRSRSMRALHERVSGTGDGHGQSPEPP